MLRIIFFNLLIFFLLLFVVEVILKIYYPLNHGGIYYEFYSGKETKPSLVDPKILLPNKKFIHKSSEFEVIVTSTDYGNRISNKHNKLEKHIFIGDSFTFGHGVNDQETFVYLFCKMKKISCVNLGKPGTDQGSQLHILQTYLKNNNIKMIQLNIFIFYSCNMEASGNDLRSNMQRYNIEEKFTEKNSMIYNQSAPLSRNKALNFLKTNLYKSDIIKRLIYLFISNLKSNLAKCSKTNEINKSFESLDFYLKKFINVAKVNNSSKIKIYAIPPYYEINNKLSSDIFKNSINLKGIKINNIDNLEIDNYYEFDGHLNKFGHIKIYEYLVNNY